MLNKDYKVQATKTTHVCTLHEDVITYINNELLAKGHSGITLSLAMSGRICDLEEVIDINEIIQRQNKLIGKTNLF